MTSSLYAVPVAREEPPKYRQIAGHLRARMESGEFPPDSRLPSVSDLMAEYHVALGTMNAALRVLRNEGRLVTEQGRGTFARKPGEPEPTQEYRYLADQIRLLDERMAAAEAWIAEQEGRGQ